MRRSTLLAMTAFLAMSASAPAMAAWDRIGSVDFSYRNDRQTQYGNFGGSVEALALQAHDSSVMCRNVTATFSNGQTASLFRGTLPVNRQVTLDLPGDQRLVRRIDFNCHANGRAGATVDISADIGRYQTEWRNSPDWDRLWARLFPNWGRGDNNRRDADWQVLGSENFQGRRDRATTVAGFRGRSVTGIALRALNDDARCMRVTATFANGQTQPLNIDRGDLLGRNRIVQLDLPGGDRNVTRIDMNCHAEHGRNVTIQVMTTDTTPDRRQGNNTRFPDRGINQVNWSMLGTKSFEGRADFASNFAGMRGDDITSIGLKPVGDDAFCSQMTATFGNGMKRNFAINTNLVENRVFQIDMPGERRDVQQVDLNCHAQHGQRVAIEIYANKG